MYTTGSVNSTMPVPMVPPLNFCGPPVYGNIPFQQPFAPPFYPHACNYYNNHATCNIPHSKEDAPQLPNFNPTSQMQLFSQPPPGYGANGARITHNHCNNNPVPSYQPVHMANVCSPSFLGVSTPNTSPIGNQFSRPPPPIPQMNGAQKNTTYRFSNRGSNRVVLDAKNSPYYCEACDRGFTALAKFNEHKSQHITCGQEGCTFSAHSKIVEKHFMMQHRTGLFNRIVKGNSPEEIQKWIAERKKHFPTKEKIEVKQAQREEMMKRGERYAERKQKFNQRNANFKSGSNNRFNDTTSNRNGQFKSKTFDHRRNPSRNRYKDENNQSSNKRKPLAVEKDEDCQLRNLLPFRGTEFYLNIENESRGEKQEQHILPDDDNFSILSDGDEIIATENREIASENVITELEKSSDTSPTVNNLEEDCLDKYFKNCDTVDEIDEKIESGDAASIETIENYNILQKKPKESDNSSVEFEKLSNEPIVMNHSVVSQSTVHNKQVLKVVNSLALIQCYDSDSDKTEDEDDTPCDSNVPSLKDIESKKSDTNHNSESVEAILQPFHCDENKTESQSLSVDKIESEKIIESSDDSGPEECSSKCVSTEYNFHKNQPCAKKIEPTENNELNDDKESVECSSKSVVKEEGNLSITKVDEETSGCESKRRKRKRRRDGKDEVECDEEGSKKPSDEKLRPVFRPRKRYKPPTLLEKLLSNEIKHERNVVLQCIRYVVNNNYFNVEKSNSS